MKILFVCTGNTCRSPMAEGILRSLAKERNINVEVKSVGISVFDGEKASKNTIEAMKKIGIDISEHKASQLHKDLVEEVDLILTLSRSHKEFVLSSYPSSKNKLFTLTEYAYGVEKDIEDPFGRSLSVYEKTRDEIYQAVIQIKEKIVKREDD